MITYEQIKPYIEKKLISEQVHPENSDVRIFNYSPRVQFDGLWDEVTKQCRGLIMNIKTDEILARPFSKFWNYSEHIDKGWDIPTEIPIITEKLDGSLGILYWLNGKPWIATRGSFTSDQAIWATEWFRENLPMFPTALRDETHLFEIIAPWNRIVVNYDYEGLVHISSRRILSGVEFSFNWPEPIRKVKRIANTNLEELVKLDELNSEGFVVFFPESNIRMKIKFPEYVRLHKLITGVSEIAIWEHLRDKDNLGDLLEKVPDEFFIWVQGIQDRLYSEAFWLLEEATSAYINMQKMHNRKEQALWIMENKKTLSGVIFSLLDDNHGMARKRVWNMIRPSGSSRMQFKVDIDL